MLKLDECYDLVESFKKGSLAERIAGLETSFRGLDRVACASHLRAGQVEPQLLYAALTLKLATAQINEVVHAIGILISLPHILEGNEIVDSLSLAAGSTGKRFDLETSLRIGEFTFAEWNGNRDQARQRELFRDFCSLAEEATPKARHLYVVGDKHPRKFLTSSTKKCDPLMGSAKLGRSLQGLWQQFPTVREYYESRKNHVQIVDLATVVPTFREINPD